ncbi:dihydrofolate reductase family protein [Streptomyces cinereoruber]|uniref:dihydrofolate reductase family protein n=1 Tax=Streptomyces cinereoruber TaxID=67260 RepID=UPI003C2B0F88
MVEGGGPLHTQLLEAELADGFRLVIAPLLVGQPDPVRVLGPAPLTRRSHRPSPPPGSPPDQ